MKFQSPRRMLDEAKALAVENAREAANRKMRERSVITHDRPTEEHPEGSRCEVHETVHGAHGWYWCEPLPNEADGTDITWADGFLEALQWDGFAVYESTRGPQGATGSQGLRGEPGPPGRSAPGASLL